MAISPEERDQWHAAADKQAQRFADELFDALNGIQLNDDEKSFIRRVARHDSPRVLLSILEKLDGRSRRDYPDTRTVISSKLLKEVARASGLSATDGFHGYGFVPRDGDRATSGVPGTDPAWADRATFYITGDVTDVMEFGRAVPRCGELDDDQADALMEAKSFVHPVSNVAGWWFPSVKVTDL